MMYRFLIAVLAVAIPLRASTTYYAGANMEALFTSDAALLTQVTSTIDFSQYSGVLGPTLANANGTGIDFVDTTNLHDLTATGGTLRTTVNGDNVSVDFPGAAVVAFSFHFTVPSSIGLWCLEPSGGNSCQYQLNNNSPTDTQFFGMISTTPLTTPLLIHPLCCANILVIDDFKVYNSGGGGGGGDVGAEAVEPATMALEGLGLLILSAVRRRVRKVRSWLGVAQSE